MGQITVFSGPERRRRWSDEERLEILAEAFAPGACVSRVARQRDVSTALIYTWRRKLCEGRGEAMPEALPEPGFAEAVVVEDGRSARPDLPAIIVDLARGRRVSVFGSASPALMAAVLKALR